RYADRRASFTKSLAHDDDGLVDTRAYAQFVAALERGDPEGFERLARDPQAEVRLNDPQAAYAFELEGPDSHATRLAAPPAFASAAMAGDIVELYWLALTRDVPFRDWDDHPDIRAATADLRACTEPPGPRARDELSSRTVFRGETAGDL